jgi:hypothetical protein
MRIKSHLEFLAEAEREGMVEDMMRTGEGMIHATTPESHRPSRRDRARERQQKRKTNIVQRIVKSSEPIRASGESAMDRIVLKQPLTDEEMFPIWHEAGHETVAARFGLSRDSASRDSAIVTAKFTGAVVHKKGTPFQNAAIAWGGAVAPAMLGLKDRGRPSPDFKLTVANSRQWFDKFLAMGGVDKMSKADRMIIKDWKHPAFPDQAWPAFEKAVSILHDDWGIVEVVAAGLERDCAAIIRASRLDPDAGERAIKMWAETGSHEAALIAARGEKAAAAYVAELEAVEESEREPMWITATVPQHLR